jgi:dethiobiotin synthetase
MEGTNNPRAMLRPYVGPGLLITGTGTDVGKTTVTAALAAAFHRMHLRVGVCKPVASGCAKRVERESDPGRPLVDDDYASADATLAARAAGLDPTDEGLLRYLAPLRYGTLAAPAVAARIEGREPDWRRVETALDWWQENCQVLLIEGAGGWYVPLDAHDFMVSDLAAALRLPVLVVTRADLGTINETLLTVHAVQERNLAVAGLVINRVPAEGKRDIAVETNLQELPRLSGVPVRAILPELTPGELAEVQVGAARGVPETFVEAMGVFAREWWQLMGPV